MINNDDDDRDRADDNDVPPADIHWLNKCEHTHIQISSEKFA